MSIIEKLWIKPLERLNGAAVKPSRLHKFVCVDPVKLTEKESQYNEMLEALIGIVQDKGGFNGQTVWIIRVIEKATGKSWMEIKELI